MDLSREQLAAYIDHTLLGPDVSAHAVAAAVAEAQELGTFSVCVAPEFLPLDAGALRVVTVCGFPSGDASDAKAYAAASAVWAGAHEIDMVADLWAAQVGDFDAVRDDVAAVRTEVPDGRVLKVILETAALTDDQIRGAALAAEWAGADYVKTSTGVHAAGGATVHAVEVLAAAVGGRLGIKASGGIRTSDDALAMIAAGATRIGTSASRAILDGLSG